MKKWVIVGGLMLVAAIFLFVGKGNMVTKRETSEISLSDIQEYINSGSSGEYSWNQEMTLVIETDEGIFSGSSVVKVIWEENSPRINDASWIPKIIGEMPFVEMPDGSFIFSLMRNGLDNLPAKFLLPEIKTTDWVYEELIRKAASETQSSSVCFGHELFPYIVSFNNPLDQQSISAFRQDSVCIHTGLVTEQYATESNIEKVLPWLDGYSNGKRVPGRFLTGDTNEMGDPLSHRVTKRDFVRN